ncbi:MAG: M15 family metallopeptidase [Pelosinus sp.]|nr:M15 family metallopeptidase [Pelosinus sp.]
MVIRFCKAFVCIIVLSLSAQGFYSIYEYDNRAAAEKVIAASTQTVTQPKRRVIPKDMQELILVNKAVRLLAEYEPADLTLVRGVYLRNVAAGALANMLRGAEQAGISEIAVVSGYRSYATQAAVYANKIARLRPEYGDAAQTEAEKLVAPPGSSEHQTGLAVDLSIASFMNREYVLNYDFAYTDADRWLMKNAWKYGFILRYTEGKEAKTGFSYEPWHYRYVGVEPAQAIYEEGICLEEYLSQ